MAIKYICDMCGAEVDQDNRNCIWNCHDDDFEVDLCPVCYMDLKDFIQMRKKGYIVEFNKPELYL